MIRDGLESERGGWFHIEDEPQFLTKGSFTAYVAGSVRRTARGSAGISSAVWSISRDDNAEPPCRYARASSQPDSDEYRAAAAAVLRVLEAIPNGSEVRIRTRQSNIANALNGGMREWQRRSWKLKGGGKRNGWEIWDRIIDLAHEKKLSVRGEHLPDDSAVIFLKKYARLIAHGVSRKAGAQQGVCYQFRRGQ